MGYERLTPNRVALNNEYSTMIDERKTPTRVTSTAAAAPLPDIEARDPVFRWMVHLGMPLLISLVVHTFLLAIMALKTFAVFRSPEERPEIPVGIRASGSATSEGFNWPGAGAFGRSEPDLKPSVEANELKQFGSMSLEKSPMPGDAVTTGGFGLGEIGRAGILGTGGGASDGGGGSGPGLGSRPGFGKAEVWSLSAAGNSFVYVVDYSGSIIVAVDELKRELKRSVGALTASQTFNVILFYERRNKVVTESLSSGLQPATPENKRSFFEWIDKHAPEGSTEPLAAIRRAISASPDAIFFFSDGYFDDTVVRDTATALKGKKTQLHTLVFDELLLQDTSGLPRLTSGAKRLKTLAEASGGSTKVVTGLDLNRK
ncbi:MAG: hypothetical protein JNG88_04065 [Phycisphaerales bacterium]|nr:hypothetical protein [Phycisphaerales bacterium]